MHGFLTGQRMACAATAAIALMSLVLLGCDGGAAPPPPANSVGQQKTLVVLTPHNEKIRYAFAAGFSSWHLGARNAPVHIKWLYRGTPQCVEFVRGASARRLEGAPVELPDVMFGGGIAGHTELAEAGLSVPVDLSDLVAEIPAELNGLPTRDAKQRWYATGLSSFGILVNDEACAARGVEPPATWADLADPRFQSWLALADPRGSGSHRECLVITLQQLGWQRGWAAITQMLANARALSARSADALQLVESGHALATLAVNFDGEARAAASEGKLHYTNPIGATAVTPDIVSVLATAADVDLAKDFVRYLMSEEGLALWAVTQDNRRVPGETLYHYPIDPKIYEKHADHLSVKLNPFTTKLGLTMDPETTAGQRLLLNALLPAAAGDNHVALQQAWCAVIDAGMPEDALAELTSPLFDEATAMEVAEELAGAAPDEIAALQAEWAQRFAQKYAKALEMAQQ